MKLTQLSIFLENKPGRLSQPCRALADAGINILTLSLADTEQFGILRLMVRDPARAKAVLEKAGNVVHATDVLAIEIPDRPGGLGCILAALEPHAINIDYMYAFTLKRGSNAVMIARIEDAGKAVTCLTQAGLSVLDAATFHTLT